MSGRPDSHEWAAMELVIGSGCTVAVRRSVRRSVRLFNILKALGNESDGQAIFSPSYWAEVAFDQLCCLTSSRILLKVR